MGLVEMIKNRVELFKIERYTKRRAVNTPDFEQKDREFYKEHYQDGVYLHHHPRDANNTAHVLAHHRPSTNGNNRKSMLFRQKSERIVRCSENYNHQ
ncbi:hypothetical protein BCR43DRAFT_511046 [Syncephalastrum racemosum]|uniref:Uncharacterized protein n=1 Tax=Syncephalastrum racemosum TaxID=13706 RepID=A0A1X2HKP2_SYNRA|nr:hypothetical protein BCR43DRAFT_511046 [Syncephalastrum racemosum]